MLRIFRFRRFRLFLAVAAVASVLLFRYSQLWGSPVEGELGNGPDDHGDFAHPLEALNGFPKVEEKVGYMNNPTKIPTTKPTQTPPPKTSSTVIAVSETPTLPGVVLPHRTRPGVAVTEDDETMEDDGMMDDIHPIGQPGRQVFPSFTAAPSPPIHWEKQVEHFPVPVESLIRLPSGPKVSIPKIQHTFNDETPDAKINREKRQYKVKEEFKKAWNGYKKHAWLHDELSPVTGKFRDPFCGWAATLVDSLDTLWIMGLQEEFEEAARAVDLIDFTTSPRADIPVFETTIRYLGGLLAAYDVSGGQYKNLLEKAVELAEILMGAFDTPNRMPVLFYRWRPAFASQPHRAEKRSNTAELGSLSMEFTRLAQLTKEPRYYDAVARITNALYEWQERGTMLDGVFPDSIDASGCNKSVPISTHQPIANAGNAPVTPAQHADPPHGYEPSAPKTVKEPIPRKKKTNDEPSDLEVQITPPAPGQPSKAKIIGWDDDSRMRRKSKRDLVNSIGPNSTETLSQAPVGRDFASGESTVAPKASKVLYDPISGLPIDMSEARTSLDKSLGDWDCTPQGLEASSPNSRNKFSMGGGQDSTYEYFPKQYLLLGGREEKYRKLYTKTMDAVRKWMIYRPMIPDNRDILFSGLVSTLGHPETDAKLTADVEHLTCFIGGMVGMGAKIFGIEGDLELASKLADGCVWAYESTASGIMPEGATVLPCKSTTSCNWNETAYREFLDPMSATRDVSLANYIETKRLRDAEKARLAESTLTKADQDLLDFQQAAVVPPGVREDDIAKQDEKIRLAALADPTHKTEPAPTSKPVSLQKRQTPKEDPKLAVEPSHGRKNAGTAQGASAKPQDNFYMDKSETTETALRDLPSGRQAEIPLKQQTPQQAVAAADVKDDPLRPLSHEEFVDMRIKQNVLPPGFVEIRGRKYILRPEAIESVWYMYRITGDPSWQDKGWRMFESIIKHTSSNYGHSAINDVTLDLPAQVDEMESFWLAETLKYFYLLYSTPDTISLDEWVLNTEAHAFKREL